MYSFNTFYVLFYIYLIFYVINLDFSTSCFVYLTVSVYFLFSLFRKHKFSIVLFQYINESIDLGLFHPAVIRWIFFRHITKYVLYSIEFEIKKTETLLGAIDTQPGQVAWLELSGFDFNWVAYKRNTVFKLLLRRGKLTASFSVVTFLSLFLGYQRQPVFFLIASCHTSHEGVQITLNPACVR